FRRVDAEHGRFLRPTPPSAPRIIRDPQRGNLQKAALAASSRPSFPSMLPAGPAPLRSLVAISGGGVRCTFASFVDAYFGRIIGSHALSFARTMRRRRAPERHNGHWGLAAGARAGAI